jgi:peroxiredoxin
MAAVALVALVAPLGCAHAPAPASKPVPATWVAAAGSSALDFTGHAIDGKDIHLATLLGDKQVVLLSFSMTFCEPCVAEFPHLRAMYEAKKAKGFIVVGIAMDGPETIANVPGYVRRNRASFPVITDEDAHISSLYNPSKAAPLSVLIDRTGKIVMVHSGYSPGDEELLGREVSKALGEPLAANPPRQPLPDAIP